MAEIRAERTEAGQALAETVVKINRTAKVVKGGRRFGFSALVVVGDRAGRVGWGFGKANAVPAAVQKATKYAQRRVIQVPIDGETIAHEVEGRFASSRVILRPARPGTGLIAGGAVRSVLESGGVKNILAKAYGSTNALNLLKATFDAISKVRSRQILEEMRGVKLDGAFMWGSRRKSWI